MSTTCITVYLQFFFEANYCTRAPHSLLFHIIKICTKVKKEKRAKEVEMVPTKKIIINTMSVVPGVIFSEFFVRWKHLK
jgi:hypothetical protein